MVVLVPCDGRAIIVGSYRKRVVMDQAKRLMISASDYEIARNKHEVKPLADSERSTKIILMRKVYVP
jgi:hypothetical protein